ncbi:hypothetical protein ACFPQ1_28805 [Rhodocytophaga aerolata]|uniref:hypothetical protein n=1 Tax=Rhodocytophaga aerolata TaxID=455078 RepID=UPI00265CCEDC|nr:hypothetical protein [Rhodocytophaga aerolata]
MASTVNESLDFSSLIRPYWALKKRFLFLKYENQDEIPICIVLLSKNEKTGAASNAQVIIAIGSAAVGGLAGMPTLFMGKEN